jgi:regulator of RNase E activity RraA
VAGTTQRIFETQIRVSCGGVGVHPGDILFGDDDGIVVATERELAEAIPVAEAIQAKEETALSRMHEGEGLVALLNFDEHYRETQAHRESRLRFLC